MMLKRKSEIVEWIIICIQEEGIMHCNKVESAHMACAPQSWKENHDHKKFRSHKKNNQDKS